MTHNLNAHTSRVCDESERGRSVGAEPGGLFPFYTHIQNPDTIEIHCPMLRLDRGAEPAEFIGELHRGAAYRR